MQRLPPIAEPLHHAGAKILKDHIGALQQLIKDHPIGFGPQVQRDAFLAVVDGRKIGACAILERRKGAGIVPKAGALYLDDARTQILQTHRGIGPGEDMGKVKDNDPLQWAAACVVWHGSGAPI